MQKIAQKHGFALVREKEIGELGARLYELSHVKTGAKLIYLDREDENKTFSISFTTPPQDSTGVFHIIEHSVLCGSNKYPLKDPFAELLKGSLNTFLNAMTYEDRTVYPVSSRCQRDFLNLVDVYLDAVFAPKLLENQSIFMQEGWHYEYDEESDSLSYNGVVYNEMKGAYSSPDEIGTVALTRALFSDSIYRHDSGGDPVEIPSLSYEECKAAHEKYYHPSNAKIILDGKMDLSTVLALIDSHLGKFEKREIDTRIEKSAVKVAKTEEVRYEISAEEDERGRAKILFGYVFSDYSDKKSHLCASILADLLCGSNASPLKKALIDRGLCKDAVIYTNKALEMSLVIEICDTNPECLEEIQRVIGDVIHELCTTGIDKKRLESIVNNLEFKMRERDFGTLPPGIAYALSMMGVWNYDSEPERAILAEELLGEIRNEIATDYFERSLLEMTVNNKHTATVVMVPDKELGRESARAERERLDKIRASLTDDEISKIKEAESALKSWQGEEESEEQINSLPKLAIEDIPEKTNEIKTTVCHKLGAKIIENDIKTNGIVYISLYFDASDLTGDELTTLSLLSCVMTNVPTENMSALDVQSRIKANLGSLIISVTPLSKAGTVTPYLKLSASALSTKSNELISIIREILLTSRVNDEAEIESIISQAKTQIEEGIISSGESLAISRVEASAGSTGAVSEFTSGYEAYKIFSAILAEDGGIRRIGQSILALMPKIIARARLTVSVSGDYAPELPEKIAEIFPLGEAAIPAEPVDFAKTRELFAVPSKVAYAAMGARSDLVRENLGIMRVVRSILSYEYLWNNVRVKNGAYGAGFIPRRDGFVSFYSYRDPAPKSSLEIYKGSGDYLREMAHSGCDLTKFIIGAVGEYDILLTPRTSAMLATQNCICGWTHEDEMRVREDMLSMTHADLIKAADIIDNLLAENRFTVVGGDAHTKSLGQLVEKVYKI